MGKIKNTYVYFIILMFAENLALANDIMMDGDVTIASMFEIQQPRSGGCGDINPASVMEMEAVRWYINKINSVKQLPFTIGLRGYSTCGNAGRAGHFATDILTKYREAKDGQNSNDFIVGLVGPSYSSEAEVVSSIFNSQPEDDRMLVISHAATAESLADRAKYPNFYRVIPGDSIQIKAMVKLMVALDWTRAAIIYVNDAYGRSGAEAFISLAKQHQICVPKNITVDVDSARSFSRSLLNEMIASLVLDSPTISGIVFIGDAHIANQILNVIERMSITDSPIFLLPESIELQASTLYVAGQILRKAKGTMVMSTPYDEVKSFTEYWKQLFSNTTLLNTAAATNPYLNQITEEMRSTLEDVQPVYLKYSVLATHTMVKAIQTAYKSICNQNMCSNVAEFKHNFRPHHLIDIMKTIEVSFPGDFNTTVEPLSEEELIFSFTNTPTAEYAYNKASYEVYNFRSIATGGGERFTFIKVGELVNNELVLNTSEIRDYRSNGAERLYADVRKGQCQPRDRCINCRPDPVAQADSYLHVPGELYIIGIISNNNRAIPGPQGCGTVRTRHGYQMFLAMKFAVEDYMTSPNFTTVRENFSNKTIGLIIINSCNNALEVVRKILELHHHGFHTEYGEIIDINNRILGYVGGQSSDVSQPAADQLTQLGMVQISYSSTNPVLSDKDRYPYFMRIVTPDNVQAEAMIAIVKALGGRYIQLVYSEGAYGEGGRDSVIASAARNSVCIAQTIRVQESDSYNGFSDILKRKPHAKLVIIFLRSHVVATFMSHVSDELRRGDFQFIGSEAWGRNSDILQFPINQGSLTVALEMKKNTRLDNYIKSQIPGRPEVNTRLEEYVTHRQNCYFPFSYDKTFRKQCDREDLTVDQDDFESDPWCIFATNTALSFLKGSGKFFQDKCGAQSSHVCEDYRLNPDALVEEIKKVEMDIDGSGKATLLYDNKGDGNMGYRIFNIQGTPQDKSKRHYVEVGNFRLSSGLYLDVDRVVYPTVDKITSGCPNPQACADCTEKEITTQKPISQTTSGSNSLTYVFGVLFSLALLLAIALLVCMIYKAKCQKIEEDPYIHPMQDRPSENSSSHQTYFEPEYFDQLDEDYDSSNPPPKPYMNNLNADGIHTRMNYST